MLMTVGTCASVALLALAGCGTHRQVPPAQGMPQMVAFDSGDSSRSSASLGSRDLTLSVRGEGLSVPHRGRNTDGVELVVRPDVLTAEFAIREVRPTSDAAWAAVRAAQTELLAQLTQTTGAAVSAKPRSASIARVTRPGQPPAIAITVDGIVDVPLAKELDFWARGRLYTTLTETTARLSESAQSKEEPLRALTFEEPQPSVVNPEGYRGQLMERWISRARGFATLAQSKEAPLSLLDCAPPATVTLSRVSLDEVTLQLAIACHIDTPRSTRRAGD